MREALGMLIVEASRSLDMSPDFKQLLLGTEDLQKQPRSSGDNGLIVLVIGFEDFVGG